MASQEYSIKHLEKANVYSSKTPSKNCRGRNTSKLILRDHHHPDTKVRLGYYKKRKLQVNIHEEYTCKNSQQNTKRTEFNSTLKESYTLIK